MGVCLCLCAGTVCGLITAVFVCVCAGIHCVLSPLSRVCFLFVIVSQYAGIGCALSHTEPCMCVCALIGCALSQ